METHRTAFYTRKYPVQGDTPQHSQHTTGLNTIVASGCGLRGRGGTQFKTQGESHRRVRRTRSGVTSATPHAPAGSRLLLKPNAPCLFSVPALGQEACQTCRAERRLHGPSAPSCCAARWPTHLAHSPRSGRGPLRRGPGRWHGVCVGTRPKLGQGPGPGPALWAQICPGQGKNRDPAFSLSSG